MKSLIIQAFLWSEESVRFLHRTAQNEFLIIIGQIVNFSACKITVCNSAKIVFDFFGRLWYHNQAVKAPASIAQSVEQLIRNQQVVCSSHITSSRKEPCIRYGYRVLSFLSVLPCFRSIAINWGTQVQWEQSVSLCVIDAENKRKGKPRSGLHSG